MTDLRKIVPAALVSGIRQDQNTFEGVLLVEAVLVLLGSPRLSTTGAASGYIDVATAESVQIVLDSLAVRGARADIPPIRLRYCPCTKSCLLGLDGGIGD